MHETSFFDASFVVLVGFLIFMGTVLKFGYRKAIQGIDTQIKEVSLTLEEAQTLLQIAKDRKQTELQLEKQLSKEIDAMKKAADKQIAELQRTMHANIEAILERKQLTADSTLDLMRSSTVRQLQETLTHEAVTIVQQSIKAFDSEKAQKLNDLAIQELKVLLTDTGANNNGGSKKKAIA